ncbi:putative lrr receptor-like serine/threonine-protein kinase rkf3 [Quercus suber]|uniref:Lrr receptor-like serine/threonine-protein kinase rkf3 n=1 Tax=Quercus suber TaxID=58331 RepID=A0AAW0JM30_QUESU
MFLGNWSLKVFVGLHFVTFQQCHYFLEGIRLVRSEYLRTNGYFLPPPTTSKACWESYQSLIGKFFVGFDIQTSCGYHPEWISKGCTNITSKAEFKSLMPESKLRAFKLYCNQSLKNTSACELCTKSLLSLGDSYLHGPERANVSVCTGYPFMYAAAVVNKFGPTDATTAKACSTVWFLWIRRMKAIRENTNSAKDEIGLILGLGSISGCTNLFKFKYEDIKKATMNFSRENLIGKGGYGNVYKGVLTDGSEVAFKRFKNCSASGDASFAHEVEVIASVRHVNLVSLRDYCIATVPFEEYALYGKLTEGIDVYSFGVVLLEILSGKKALETNEGKAYLLTNWAWSLVQRGRALDVIKEGMPELGSCQMMEQYVLISILCAHPVLHARPTMEQVVKILETNSANWSVFGLF